MNRRLVGHANDQVKAHVDELRCTAVTCLDTLLIRRFAHLATHPSSMRWDIERSNLKSLADDRGVFPAVVTELPQGRACSTVGVTRVIDVGIDVGQVKAPVVAVAVDRLFAQHRRAHTLRNLGHSIVGSNRQHRFFAFLPKPGHSLTGGHPPGHVAFSRTRFGHAAMKNDGNVESA
jgi:hypothetical protein